MSNTPMLFILVLGLFLVVGMAVVVVAQLRVNLSKVASVVSRITIVVSMLWLVLMGFTLFGGGPLTVTAPVVPMPLQVSDGVELHGLTASILGGGFDRVTVHATGLSTTMRVITLLGAALGSATLIGVCLVVARLARSLGERDPFALGGAALQRAAWIVLVGGILSSVLDDVANWRASLDLFWVGGWSATGDLDSVADVTQFGWPQPAPFSLTIPFWPLGAALVLALLAGVFRYGGNLRRDAEGLV